MHTLTTLVKLVLPHPPRQAARQSRLEGLAVSRTRVVLAAGACAGLLAVGHLGAQSLERPATPEAPGAMLAGTHD